MSVSELSTSTQNYLKAIWGLKEWSSEPVTATLISARLGLKLSSVSDAVRKMTKQGLVSHTPYGAVELTGRGRQYALDMVRRHRLLESFLVQALDYTWDEVHDEAENLEHAVSDMLIERVDKFLNFPSRDPHGDPIPTADGNITIPRAHRLSDSGAQSQVIVERISDSDPQLLAFLKEHGIVTGAVLDTREGAPFSDSLEVRVFGSAPWVLLGRPATDAVFVAPHTP
ncbi:MULTISPECIES: metal-dependent transcriptional regulator [Corynebacterium]|uniref:Diphtheria toxin repressor n=1 Tax=Corynebacterium striatum TaxID=43770 RepID=A0AAQ1TX73_CORST|nr:MULTISPECIES: metal-dependent transcriptional regulator [Corynebacterium]EEI79426.1 iron dependent repressor DNA binding domain protein [Corynebacterium striatum ATCC 6940]MBD0855505.1 metal-dependent transcriptional regulator [Corynebacterium striatum]MDK8813495.1 metal-dependent transcriptional regulator [Corynebacterium striatum]OFT51575.1 transcriptional regulator [Corynebacterium sp. HMSC06C06]PIS67570.1 transcriptional regulator [Corynebacterium striatum]